MATTSISYPILIPGSANYSADDEDTPIKVWTCGDKKIALFRQQGDLQCLVIDTISGKSGRLPLDGFFKAFRRRFPFQSIDEKIDFLKEREPIFDEEGSVIFRLTCVYDQRLDDNKEIRLGSGEKDLYWELFDRTINSVSWIYVTEDITHTEEYLRCSGEETRRRHAESRMKIIERGFEIIPSSQTNLQTLIYARFMRAIPLEQRIAHLKNFEVDKVIVGEDRDEFKSVVLKKISIKSHFDDSMFVDMNRWTVTLACFDQYKYENPLTWSGAYHAEIFVEGIHQGELFFHQSHLVPVGVRQNFLTHREIKTLFTDRKIKTKTWQSSAVVVKEMMRKIKWEIDAQEKGEKPVPFHLLGRASLFNRLQRSGGINWDTHRQRPVDPDQYSASEYKSADNCISWAIDKLKIVDIELAPLQLDWLYQRPNPYLEQPAIQSAQAQFCVML